MPLLETEKKKLNPDFNEPFSKKKVQKITATLQSSGQTSGQSA